MAGQGPAAAPAGAPDENSASAGGRSPSPTVTVPPAAGRDPAQEPAPAGAEGPHPERRPARLAGWLRGHTVTLVAIAAAAAVGAGAAVVRDAGPAHGGSLDAATAACGRPAARLAAGHLSFTVRDTSPVYASVYLTDPKGAEVYAEIPWLAPNRSAPMTTALAAGTYAFRCVMSDGAVHTSKPVSVVGTTDSAVRGYRPLPDLAMTAPVAAYRSYLEQSLPGLLAHCRTLDADVGRGDLAAARRDWLTAHLAYERLGAAYTSFGDFDGEIDGLPDGLPKGLDDPDWTGFFALEHALWHGASAAAVRPLTRSLVSAVGGLGKDFPSQEIDPGDLPLRAHEILENSLQFQLTGDADYGSGTTLATLDANLDGTAEVMRVLRPLITPRDQGLAPAVDNGIARVRADVAATRGPDGAWVPVHQLPAAQRQRIDGDLGALLERLSTVPDLLSPRTSA